MSLGVFAQVLEVGYNFKSPITLDRGVQLSVALSEAASFVP
jgi:hypothetical protein